MTGRARARRAMLVCALLLLGTSGTAERQHIVAPGDTLYAIARRYGTSVADLRSRNGLAGDLLAVGQRLELPPAPGFRFVASAAGDTLAGIAERHGLLLSTVAAANPGLPTAPAPGTRVRIPPADGVVERLEGDGSLLELALRHGAAVSEVLEVNGLGSLADAGRGDWVLIPLAAVPAATPLSGSAGRPASAEPALAGPDPADVRNWHDERQRRLLEEVPRLMSAFRPRSDGFLMPVQGILSSGFGWRNVSVAGNRFHGGIDVAVDEGTEVVAAADGVVSSAGWVGAYGYSIYLDHEGGAQSRYAHLSVLLVRPGQFVRQGDVIALSGNSGASTGPHLHFEIRIDGSAVDPLGLLGRRQADASGREAR